MKIITEFIKLSDIFWLLYFTISILFGYISFFIWLPKNINNIWSLKIFIPHVVDPAHPPTNIKNKKNIKENFPQRLKSSVTYPVPDKIETTLKEDILNLSSIELSWFIKNKYKNITMIEKTNRYIRPLIWTSVKKTFVFPFINLR